MLSLVLFAAAATLQPNLLVSTSWLADHVNDPNVVVLDVATMQQFSQGHLPGARLIEPQHFIVDRGPIPNELPPVADLEALFTQAGIANADHIIVYSREPLLATRAFFTLDYLGYGEKVSLLDGSFVKWAAEVRPLTKELATFEPVPFKARINHVTLIDQKTLKRDLRTKAVVLIDARPHAQFIGTEKGEGIRLSGHIPSAKCMPWQANFKATEEQIEILKSEDELRGIYASYIGNAEKKIVVYCRTGMEASVPYFVLRYLGYQPALYDGSFIEWNKTESVARAAKLR